jgi:hypothetical protein
MTSSRNSSEFTADVLWRLRWPVFSPASDIKVLELDQCGRPDPKNAKPFSNPDGSGLHPVASEILVQSASQPPNKSTYVNVLNNRDPVDEEFDPWPDTLMIKGDRESGITVLEFMEQLRPYFQTHQSTFTDCWVGVEPLVEAKDVYLVDFTLYFIEDSVYSFSLTLGDGRERHPYWATVRERPIQDGSGIWQAPTFKISKEDEPDTEVRKRLAKEHFQAALGRAAEENLERLRAIREAADAGI